jgi:hypothetical protein
MKMAFIEFITSGTLVLDVGIVVCDPTKDYEVLGYMGETVAVQDGDDEGFPVIAQVNGLIKPSALSDVDISVLDFIEGYLENEEDYMLLSRDHKPHALCETYWNASAVVDLDVIEEFFRLYQVESDHDHDQSLYEELDTRAVRKCVYDHAEYIVYRNNLITWAGTVT